MPKQAALSIRILESIKREIAATAAKEHRSVSSLVEKILDDYLQAMKTGTPRKYSDDPNAYEGNLYEMPQPTGKTLGETTKSELGDVAKAFQIVGQHFQKAALELAKEHPAGAAGEAVKGASINAYMTAAGHTAVSKKTKKPAR